MNPYLALIIRDVIKIIGAILVAKGIAHAADLGLADPSSWQFLVPGGVAVLGGHAASAKKL